MTIANTIQRMTISFLEQSTQNKWSNEENSEKKNSLKFRLSGLGSATHRSTRIYENRVCKHFVIYLNFLCLSLFLLFLWYLQLIIDCETLILESLRESL